MALNPECFGYATKMTHLKVTLKSEVDIFHLSTSRVLCAMLCVRHILITSPRNRILKLYAGINKLQFARWIEHGLIIKQSQ